MRDVVQKQEKPKKKSNPKGFGPSMPATEEQQAMVLKKKTKIQKKIKKEFPDKFQAISYRRTVQGHTDEIIIDVGPEFNGQQVKITVVQKANGSYLLWNADWHTPDEEVEVGQLEVQPEAAPEDSSIKGKGMVMKKKEGSSDNIKGNKIVEKIEEAQVAVLESAPVLNSAPPHMMMPAPKKSKTPMTIHMGGSSPQPQVMQRPMQQAAPQPQVMVQQRVGGPSLLTVTVIDNAYVQRNEANVPANQRTYLPRQQKQKPQQFAPHVLFVKTVNPF